MMFKFKKPKRNGFHWLFRKGKKPTIVKVYDLKRGSEDSEANVSWNGGDECSNLGDMLQEGSYKWSYITPPK